MTDTESDRDLGLTPGNPYMDRMDQLNHEYIRTLHEAGMDPVAVFVIRGAPEIGMDKVTVSAMMVQPEGLGISEGQMHQIVVRALRQMVQDIVVAHPEAFNLPKASA